MSEFYFKNLKGEFVPVELEKVITKDLANSLVTMKVGTDQNPATEHDVDALFEVLAESDAMEKLDTSSFIITAHNVEFEVLDSLKDIKNKSVAVRVTSTDDLSKLGNMQKQVKKMLQNHVKKVVFFPAPITVDEYQEVMDIKRRCDVRRQRRGN